MSYISIPKRVQDHLYSTESFVAQIQGKKPLSKTLETKRQSLSNEESFSQPIIYQTPIVYQNYSPLTYSISRIFLKWLFPSTHTVHHYHHQPSSSNPAFSSPTAPSSPFSKKEHPRGAKIILSTIALALAGFCAYSLGQDLATLAESQIDERQLSRERRYTQHFMDNAHLPSHTQHQFKDIFDLQQEILSVYKKEAYLNLLFKGCTATGLIMGSLSYLFKQSSTYTYLGSAMAAIGGVSWVIKTGFGQSQHYIQKLANQLSQTLLSLKRDIEIRPFK